MANATKSFVGSYVLGMGFTFDDTGTRRSGATPLVRHAPNLIAKGAPKRRKRIFPYIGGEEVNDSVPRTAHHRYRHQFR